jgi:hypothetical protein
MWQRLRRALCKLSELAWAIDPNFRASWAYQRILQSSLKGLDHKERLMLALALVRISEVGLRVAGHVHDEVLIEGEYDVSDISALMCEPNGWSVGLPLDAAGYVTARYRKE